MTAQPSTCGGVLECKLDAISQSVQAAQTDGAVIAFKKNGQVVYRIQTDDRLTDSANTLIQTSQITVNANQGKEKIIAILKVLLNFNLPRH